MFVGRIILRGANRTSADKLCRLPARSGIHRNCNNASSRYGDKSYILANITSCCGSPFARGGCNGGSRGCRTKGSGLAGALG